MALSDGKRHSAYLGTGWIGLGRSTSECPSQRGTIGRRVEIQIFGSRKSAETRAALRFFAERRIKVHFVDFAVRGPSVGELTRFAQRFGVAGIIDPGSKRFQELGWAAARHPDQRWIEKLTEEPLALRMPLVRHQRELTVGAAEEIWKGWR
jgi:arsenate reductase-like glutaredoxin family protein